MGVNPKAKDHGSSIAGQARASQQKRPAHVRFGSKADIASCLDFVRFTPKADKQQMTRFVCFVPKADSGTAAKNILTRSPRRRAARTCGSKTDLSPIILFLPIITVGPCFEKIWVGVCVASPGYLLRSTLRNRTP